MNLLHHSYFFDLSKYTHRALFDDCVYVWQALNHISSYLKKHTLGHIEVKIPAGVHLVDQHTISIGKGTTIEPGAYIKGPCIIGENCQIRHGAYIRGNFICGNNCVVGHDTEVKNSIFLDGVHAAHFAYVGDSILGNDVNLGAGTVCANLKFDRGMIAIRLEGKAIGTDLGKLGAIMGDRSQTGCNSVTNPGTLLGKQVFCYPCMNIGGFVPSDYIVKTSEKILLIPNNPK